MGKYFGTDGFRGEANVDLTVEHAFKVGRFLGWYFGKNHKARIVILWLPVLQLPAQMYFCFMLLQHQVFLT